MERNNFKRDVGMSQLLDFKISSGLKDIIGKELITNDRIAIFELVKNSYDANAREVKIVFQNITATEKDKTSKILIIDDGDGMTMADFKKKWLFVGYSDKKYFEKGLSIDYRHKIMNQRILAGAKGVGRFSCDRLGKNLKIYSKKEGKSKIHYLNVDWSKFEVNQEQEFQAIKVQYAALNLNKVEIENYPIRKFRKGTILEITGLNDKWDKAKLLELKKYLQRLVNPSHVDDKQAFKIILEAKEYVKEDKKVKKSEGYNLINGLIKNDVFEKLDNKTTQIKSSINDGKIKTELIDKGKFIFSLEEKSEFVELNNITVNLFYLNQAAKNSFTRIMGVPPKSYGSIFLYKNKFRIHPYGDEGNDWLELEKRKGQGYRRFLANRELMGRIELHGSQPNFKEVSSRDGGVIVTDAYKQLQNYFIEKLLRRLEKYVREGIDWDKEDAEKQKSPEQIKIDSLKLIQKLVGQIKDPEKNIQFNPDLLTIFKDKQVENLPEVIKNVEALKKYVNDPEEKDYIENQLHSVRIAIKTLEIDKLEAEKEAKIKGRESLFLAKVVSADNEIVTNLNHTIENSTLTIRGMILKINKRINGNCPISEIIPFIDKVSIENEKIIVISEIVSVANFDTKINAIKADIVVYIKEYLERIKKAEILHFEFINSVIEHVTSFKPIEISIILDNLISNSIKAGANSMTLCFKNVNKKLIIQFADNGKGVNSEIHHKIFGRGYTTTKGAGVGLHYVKTTLEKVGGRIEFLGNGVENLEKGACFEVTIP
jgi:anti-sigma regulatory factor (Ser/Thr protein kinase)